MGDDVGGMARYRLTAFDSLLVASKGGDESAFAALWRWLHPPLVRWLAVVAGDDADDIASEVWLAVARTLDGFEGGDQQFTAWVFTIARRRVIDGRGAGPGDRDRDRSTASIRPTRRSGLRCAPPRSWRRPSTCCAG